MKKSFELEDSFRNLNQIPRSELQKRKTFNTIIQTGRTERSAHFIARNWTGNLLTMVMVLVCAAYLIAEIKSLSPEQTTAHNTSEIISPGEIVITYLTKSDSDNHFNLQSNLTRKGVSIIDEPVWLATMNRTINGRNIVKKAQDPEGTYDILLIYEGRKPDKCKLWISENNVYIKRVREKRVYQVEAHKAAKVIAMIEDMEKQVQF